MRQGKMCGVVLTVLLAVVMLGGYSSFAQAQPVHFKELMAIVAVEPPQGWEVAKKPKGQTMKSPIQMSEAEVEFKSGDKRLEVKIVDGLGGMMPLMGLMRGMEMESSEEYMKSIEVQGFKGTESYKYNEKEGDIKLPVANRFLVTIEGKGIDNTDVLKEVAGKLDLKKLAGQAK
jgi:hypothetical protein